MADNKRKLKKEIVKIYKNLDGQIKTDIFHSSKDEAIYIGMLIEKSINGSLEENINSYTLAYKTYINNSENIFESMAELGKMNFSEDYSAMLLAIATIAVDKTSFCGEPNESFFDIRDKKNKIINQIKEITVFNFTSTLVKQSGLIVPGKGCDEVAKVVLVLRDVVDNYLSIREIIDILCEFSSTEISDDISKREAIKKIDERINSATLGAKYMDNAKRKSFVLGVFIVSQGEVMFRKLASVNTLVQFQNEDETANKDCYDCITDSVEFTGTDRQIAEFEMQGYTTNDIRITHLDGCTKDGKHFIIDTHLVRIDSMNGDIADYKQFRYTVDSRIKKEQ